MRKIYKLSFLLLASFTLSISVMAQNNFFTDAGENRVIPTSGNRVIIPAKYRVASLDRPSMRNFLWALPSEQSLGRNRSAAPVLTIPMPDGSTARFRVWQSSIQEPGLEAKFPEIKTFVGQGIDDRYATIRMDYGPNGFHAQVLTVNGTFYIDPYARGEVDNYITYFRTDFRKSGSFLCEVPDNPSYYRDPTIEAVCLGTDLRTYRLAVACTGEYAQAPGISAGANPVILHNAIVTSVNRVVGVYEQEVSIRMVLVANNNLVEFLDAGTDPFTGNNNANILINESQTVIDANIGSANYDIGHTFSTGGGGLAQLNSPCGPSKARGITGSPNPTGDPYDIDYVAHEMGHQFGGNHSMSGCGSSPNSTKYEVGSGTTIQAYAGICGTQNIQPNSDPFFHAISFDEISNFVVSGGGNTCSVVTPTGNNLPVIAALPNNNLSIPPSTPFTLSASATDVDGDALTYNWEQWDFNPSGGVSWNAGATGPVNNSYPLFKSRIPKVTGSRTFPDIAVILAGYPASPAATMGGLKGETLSPVARAIKFKVTVRDNRAGGGGSVSSGSAGCQTNSTFTVNVVGTTPFAVTVPNGGESYPASSTQTITWNVAGTSGVPVSVTDVRILLSTDGGLTYPTVISASTPNDGSESVTIPSVPPTTTAIVKVEALGNIFFDISNANFSITAAPSGFSFNSPVPVVATCPTSGTMQTTITATYNGVFSNPITLSAIAFPAGTSVTFGTNPLTTSTTSSTVTLNNTGILTPGNYTVTVQGVASGAPTQTRDITFTVSPGAGPAITLQPVNSTICAGDNTSFTVTSATATGFQWQVSTDGGGSWNNVVNGGVYAGATTNTLNLTGVPAGFNNYRYRVNAAAQCGVTTSNAAILTVNTAASITNHPQDITLCAGSNHTFSVSATGTGLTYQWQVSVDGGTIYNNVVNGGVYSGATTANLTLTGITAGMNNYKYKVIVTGSGTCPAPVTSNVATLSVVTSVAITTQPTDQTICAGGNTSFTVAGSGAGIIYQWQVSTDGGGTWTNVTNGGVYSGATSATLTITGGTVSMNGYRYRALLSNSTCTTPGTSNAAILTVNSLPAVTSNPNNSTICLGGNTSFTAAGTGTGATYQWQVSTDGGVSWNNVINGGVYGGATTGTLTITGATASMNGYRYRLVVSGTCPPPVNSASATLTVVNPVVVSAQPAPVVICSGSNASFTVAGTSTETISYQWQVSTDAGSSWNNVANGGVYSGATTATLSITAAPVTMNSYLYRALLNNTTCTSPTASNSALLTVRLLPTVGLTAAPLTSLLPGQTTTLTATPSAPAAGATQTIAWVYNGVAAPTITGNTYIADVEDVGTYQVLIQAAYTGPNIVCSNQSPIVTITATASSRLFIFPSPNDGRFTVSYYNNGGASTKRSIAIFDSKGSIVYNRQFNIVGAYTLIPIDLRQMGRGIYYVVVGDASGNKLAEGKVHVR